MSVPRFCADTWHALREKFYFLHDNFSSLRRQFSRSAQKVFVTKFVTCITNFVTRITKFLTSVTKFVTKNISEKIKDLCADRKNCLRRAKKIAPRKFFGAYKIIAAICGGKRSCRVARNRGCGKDGWLPRARGAK